MLWESETRANSNINQIIKKAIMKNLVSSFKAGIVILFLLVFNQKLLSQTMELIKLINSGTKFQVELTYNNGTLVAGKTYDVVYTNGEFSVTGYNNGRKSSDCVE